MPAHRKPTAVLEAAGALDRNPGRHADRLNEPKPKLGAGTKPPSLSPEASAHWDELSAMLTESRVLSIDDSVALAMLCEDYAAWRIAQNKVNSASKADRESRVHDRDLARLHKAHNKLLDLLRDFGMTPASRSKVQAIPKDPKKNSFGALADG
jgi:P27 family predicted phage terminase small subunit